MPNLQNKQYGTHFEEDDVPSKNLHSVFQLGMFTKIYFRWALCSAQYARYIFLADIWDINIIVHTSSWSSVFYCTFFIRSYKHIKSIHNSSKNYYIVTASTYFDFWCLNIGSTDPRIQQEVVFSNFPVWMIFQSSQSKMEKICGNSYTCYNLNLDLKRTFRAFRAFRAFYLFEAMCNIVKGWNKTKAID